MANPLKQIKKMTFKVALVAAIGGLLNGFLTGVIAAVLPILRDEWNLSSNQQEWLAASALLGAVAGAIISIRAVNIIGRRNSIMLASVLFCIGSVACAFSYDLLSLILCRVVIGLGIGLSSYTIPLYITEISPSRNRSALLTLNQLMITIGILFAYLNSLSLINTDHNWRWMFLTAFIPAAILFIGMRFLPKTPKWLVYKGRFSEARSALMRIEETDQAENILDLIKQEVDTEKHIQTRWRDLHKSKYMPVLMLSIAIMFFQQCTGINIFIYYSPVLFEIAGAQSLGTEMTGAVLLGLANVLFTVISISLIEHYDRKTIYYFGLTGMTVVMAILGFAFYNYSTIGISLKWIVICGSFLYVMFFSMSMGPIAWLFSSELFPSRVRNLGMSVSIIANWAFNFIIIFTFFTISKHFNNEFILQKSNRGIEDIFFNPAVNFWLYGLFGVCGLVFGYYLLPETKHMSSMDIDEYWNQRIKKKGN